MTQSGQLSDLCTLVKLEVVYMISGIFSGGDKQEQMVKKLSQILFDSRGCSSII